MTSHRDQLMLDIFTTALEGGIGYWSVCEEYHWLQRDEFGVSLPGEPEDVNGFYAIVVDSEEHADKWDFRAQCWKEKPEHLRIDKQVVTRGYNLATTTEWQSKIRWSSERPPLVVTEDGWDYDAGDADCIVQLGLFGEVVYG